jgi:hypothetical protein
MVWTANGAGTGRCIVSDQYAVAFTGFAAGKLPIDMGGIHVTQLETLFASIILTPADPTKPIADADRLLVCALARSENTDQQWNEQRTSLSTHWGKAPPRIEVVKATISLPADYTVRALDGAGKVIKEFKTVDKVLKIGEVPTVWYELVRR